MSELLHVAFRVVVIDRDENGVICGERPIAEGTVSPAALDRLPDEVRELAANDLGPGATGPGGSN